MGGGQSQYVKVKISRVTGLAAKFAFEQGTEKYKTYTMVTVYTNPTMIKKEIINIKKNDYDDNDWDWYEYNGDVTKMIRIFENFDPKPQNLGALLTCLEMECELKKYKNLWDTVKEWLDSVLILAARILGGVVAPIAMPGMYAYQTGLLKFW